MQTIVINSQKGGSGKSALCRVLSVEATKANPDGVYLIDLDPQGTLKQWHDVRESDNPKRVEVNIDNLKHDLKTIKKLGANYTFIDTPPQASENLDEVFSLADLVIIPVRASPDDLKAASVTVNRLKALKVRFIFALNQCAPNAGITAQAIAVLSHHGPVAETLTGNRVIYPGAFTDGRAPQELEPKGPAAKEITKLWANIQTFIGNTNG